jgi:tRNA A-37 threonylcarbamoyl transferase component Bud32
VKELEQALRDLPRTGTLVKDRGYRQVWRFEHGGKAYFLKFYPHHARKRLRGSPAMREFFRLQWLQRAEVPAPRAVAVLTGFKLRATAGDLVILDAIEPSIQLDQYLNRLHLNGERAPDHRELMLKVIRLVYKLGQARLGHSDLHLGNFLLKDGELYLLDGYAVHRGGLTRRDVFQLGHSATRYATTGDLIRGWDSLTVGGFPPRRNPISPRIWRKFIERAHGGNRYFGKLTSGGWSGVFFSHFKYPHRWADASRLEIPKSDWEREWPALLRQIEGGGLQALKRGRSGEVLAAEVTLAGRPVSVIVKRPRRRYWYRYLNEIGRGSRARRAWFKAWNLVIRNIPTAWPLLLMERRTLGYVTDAVFICERVPGKDLAVAELDEMTPVDRDNLFRRAGRILRRIERFGFSHFDAKASNWIVKLDEKTGPQPVLVDVDGIRRRQWVALGIERLLRSMREHEEYTPDDSLALCQGYAPFAKFAREGGEE